MFNFVHEPWRFKCKCGPQFNRHVFDITEDHAEQTRFKVTLILINLYRLNNSNYIDRYNTKQVQDTFTLF